MGQKILIHRSDNIGDVILTLPVATHLKRHLPDCEITFLSREYVKHIIDACPDIDNYLDIQPFMHAPLEEAAKKLAGYNFDIFINHDPKAKAAKLAKHAKIPKRIGTSHRLFHWFTCNKLVHYSRARSPLHEAQLNFQLLRPLQLDHILPLEQLYPKLHVDTHLNQQLANHLKADRFNLIIHPGSNLNGKEWPTEYYADLINRLDNTRFNVLITGGPNEIERFKAPLIDHCPNATNLMGKMTLPELMQFIAAADGLVASGTGPLHLAAALGVHTLGLFPDDPVKGIRRWQPVGPNAHYLVAKQACNKDCARQECRCMHTITVNDVKEKLDEFAKHSNRLQQDNAIPV